MDNAERKVFSEEATRILHEAGYTWSGRKWSELLPPGERIKVIPQPPPGRSTRKPPRTIRVYFGG